MSCAYRPLGFHIDHGPVSAAAVYAECRCRDGDCHKRCWLEFEFLRSRDAMISSALEPLGTSTHAEITYVSSILPRLRPRATAGFAWLVTARRLFDETLLAAIRSFVRRRTRRRELYHGPHHQSRRIYHAPKPSSQLPRHAHRRRCWRLIDVRMPIACYAGFTPLMRQAVTTSLHVSSFTAAERRLMPGDGLTLLLLDSRPFISPHARGTLRLLLRLSRQSAATTPGERAAAPARSDFRARRGAALSSDAARLMILRTLYSPLRTHGTIVTLIGHLASPAARPVLSSLIAAIAHSSRDLSAQRSRAPEVSHQAARRHATASMTPATTSVELARNASVNAGRARHLHCFHGPPIAPRLRVLCRLPRSLIAHAFCPRGLLRRRGSSLSASMLI